MVTAPGKASLDNFLFVKWSSDEMLQRRVSPAERRERERERARIDFKSILSRSKHDRIVQNRTKFKNYFCITSYFRSVLQSKDVAANDLYYGELVIITSVGFQNLLRSL